MGGRDASAVFQHEGARGVISAVLDAVPLDGPTAVPPFPWAADAARAEWALPLPPPVLTGLALLDEALGGGMRTQSVYVVNAPTGRGKTGLAIQLARHRAGTHPTIYLTSELAPRQVLARVAAQVIGEPWSRLFDRGPEEAERIAAALEGLRLAVVELRPDTVIADVLKRFADVTGAAPFMVLDYLQHAARRLNPTDLRLATAGLCDGIGQFMRESKGTALLVSAVGRPFYSGNGRRGAEELVASAKESGDVEFDATALMFLDCDLCPPGGMAEARLTIAKSRFGGSGRVVGLRFNGAVGMFTSDPSASLTEEQRAAYSAIRRGATSVEEVRKALGIGKGPAGGIVGVLAARGLIDRNPLRVRAEVAP